jgi:hypothetical protein
MNLEEHFCNLVQLRQIETLYQMTARKVLARCASESAAGRETPSEGLRSEIALIPFKFLVRAALTFQNSIPEILERALPLFKGRDDLSRDFIRDLGIGLDRGMKRPARYDNHVYATALRVIWLDGFILPPTRNQKKAAVSAVHATWPPLSRWNGRAAWQLLKMREPGLDERTYRQRVSRLGLYQFKPILVQKTKISPSTVTLTYTPAGERWLRDLLGAVTQNREKMFHDTETKLRVNSIGETPGTHLARSRNRRTLSA